MQVLYSSLEGVAWYAHIGGFVFGLVMIKLFSKKPLLRGLKAK
jgi:membrane associated rhomboid family serine protease